MPDEIFKSSHFERRFVTPFGTVWEDLAVAVAVQGLGLARKGYTINGKVKSGRLEKIAQILNNLEHPAPGEERYRPDWEAEIQTIMRAGGEDIPVQVTCDVYVEDLQTKKRYAFELKAPLPNSDQTKVSKEKLLKLYSMEPPQIDTAYFALPYNPYGSRQEYAWSFPARWFNMHQDTVVLIGEEFWEMIGGSGTYQAFLEAVSEIGAAYKERIYREFLGIEPPHPDRSRRHKS